MSALACSGCGARFYNSSTLSPGAACSLCGSTVREKRNPAADHICHAIDCVLNVPPKMLFCLRHWRMVPADIQTAVWCAYVPGQEIRKNPTGRYLLVQALAVATVAARERKWSTSEAADFVCERSAELQALRAVDQGDIEYVMRVLNRSELKARAAC